jgi:hypothetical protein
MKVTDCIYMSINIFWGGDVSGFFCESALNDSGLFLKTVSRSESK